jgi:hypothetical protein
MSLLLLPNPAYAGKKPQILDAVCHDRTPFLTICCHACFAAMHVHESQLGPPELEMAMRCARCRKPTIAEPGELQAAFQRMRDEGWIE